MDPKRPLATAREEHDSITNFYGPESASQNESSDRHDLPSVVDVEDLALLSGGFNETGSDAVTLIRKMR